MQFHDQLANELPTLRGKWNFNFKVFRNNPFSLTNGVAESKFLHTLSLSYLPEVCLTLVNKKSAGVFSNNAAQDAGAMGFPDEHLHRGATSGFNDPFDSMVALKLQSLWLQKQVIKGDGGQIYELENGNVTIRTSNVFLHGIFKGLLIQVNTNSSDNVDEVMKKYGIPKGHVCKDTVCTDTQDEYGDLCLQYVEILNF